MCAQSRGSLSYSQQSHGKCYTLLSKFSSDAPPKRLPFCLALLVGVQVLCS
jgi:hypothetical protein